MKYSVPISIIMPVRQGERFLSKAVESILGQTFGDFELIIVNDGSTDATEAIATSYLDKRIQYHKANFGNNYKARNLGMSLSKGKYICMADSDDISLPRRLEEQFKYMEKYRHVAVLGTQTDFINEDGKAIKTLQKRPTQHQTIRTWQLMNIYIAQPTLMLRSHIYHKHGIKYNTDFLYAGDYDHMVRLSTAFRLANLDTTLVQYRNHATQISSQKSEEQGMFANRVRERQLMQFDIDISQVEKQLHIRLMTHQYLKDKELTLAEGWLNRLLEANRIKRWYNPSVLYKLFELVLAIAVNKNSLGGWAIEKELLDFIERTIPAGNHILELGSGDGTDALLDKYKVTSVEHDIHFHKKRKKDHNSILAPIFDGWYDRKKVKEALAADTYALIIVDGPPGNLRKGLEKNLDLFNGISVPVLFDDMNRELDRRVMERFCRSVGYEHELFKGIHKMFAICKPKVEDSGMANSIK